MLPSAVHGEVGKSATSAGRSGRFDAIKDESIDTGSGNRAISSSPGWGPWAAGGSGGMLGLVAARPPPPLSPPLLLFPRRTVFLREVFYPSDELA